MINVSRKNNYKLAINRIIVLGVLIIAINLSGCTREKTNIDIKLAEKQLQDKLSPNATEPDKLNHYKVLWEAFKEKHYRYIVYIECHCQFSTAHNFQETATAMTHDKWINIEVNQGKIVKIRLEDGQESDLQKDKFLNTNPITFIFERIESGINLPARELNVTYNNVYGFPQKVRIIFTNAVDDTLHAEIRDFELLN